MKYDFKVLLIVKDGDEITDSILEPLRKEFSDGWEYVDKIIQSVSTGGGSYHQTEKSAVAVILKREKPDLV